MAGSLPYDEHAERSVCSAVLQRPEEYARLARAENIGPRSFHLRHLGRLYELSAERLEAGEPAELPAIIGAIPPGELENMGGHGEVAGVFTYAPAPGANFLHYCGKIREKHALRRAYNGAGYLQGLVEAGKGPQELLRASRELGENLAGTMSANRLLRHVGAAADDFEADFVHRVQGDQAVRLPTGIPELDEITDGGFGRGWLVTIAGPTKGGKSMLASQIALGWGERALRGAYYTLEMTTGETLERMVANDVNVHLSVLANPKRNLSSDPAIRQDQLRRINASLHKIHGLPLWLSDDPTLSLSQLCDSIEERHEQDPLDWVVLDYLQLLRGKTDTRNREREVAHMSATLKRLAQRLKICITILSQLNDQGRMRESRAIAQDSNAILEVLPDTGVNVVQRQGATGMAPIVLEGHFARFVTRPGQAKATKGWDDDES